MSKCEKCKHHNSEDFFVCDGCIHETSLKDRYEPLTNADRIRAMSDEELADYLAEICSEANNGTIYSDRPEEWLEWLKQPAEV